MNVKPPLSIRQKLNSIRIKDKIAHNQTESKHVAQLNLPNSNDKNAQESQSFLPTQLSYEVIEADYLERTQNIVKTIPLLKATDEKKIKSIILSIEAFEQIWRILKEKEVDESDSPSSQADKPAKGEMGSRCDDLRSWVHDEFSLSLAPTHLRSDGEIETHSDDDDDDHEGKHTVTQVEVLMHGSRMVARQNNMHEILSFCHLKSGLASGRGRHVHGNLEETLMVVEAYYAFVPYEIVESFVKICPGCSIRTGVPSSTSLKEMVIDIEAARARAEGQSDTQTALSPDISDSDNAQGTDIDVGCGRPSLSIYTSSRGLDLTTYADQLRTAGPSPELLSPDEMPPMLFSRFSSRSSNASCKSGTTFSSHSGYGFDTPLSMSRTGSASTGTGSHGTGESESGLKSLPMSREVSLFQGLPNGWQYFMDYEAAVNEFVGMGLERSRSEPHIHGGKDGYTRRIVEEEAIFRKDEGKANSEAVGTESEESLRSGSSDGNEQEPDTVKENRTTTEAVNEKLKETSVLGTGGLNAKPRIPSISPLRSGNWANMGLEGGDISESISVESVKTARRVSVVTRGELEA